VATHGKRFFASHGITAPRVVLAGGNDILRNLAIEEWLSREGRPTLFLWRNDKTVVIGKHQNPWLECNMQAMDDDAVTLARRKSGGGAVYQDLGNTCFSFFAPEAQHSVEDNNGVIIRALANLGVEAEATGRNDITVGGKKVSGAAFRPGRVALHHGTLLINLDMTALGRYLNPNVKKLAAKGVTSVRARVMNLAEADATITHDAVVDALIDSFKRQHGVSEMECLTVDDTLVSTHADLAEIDAGLRSWEWRVGQTPNFQHQMDERFEWGLVDVHMDVAKGKVATAAVYSDCLDTRFPEILQQWLVGAAYSPEGMTAACSAAKAALDGSPAMAWCDDAASWLSGQVL
jgi:lipoate-protein ligase A